MKRSSVNPISKLPHRRIKRFIPKAVLVALRERSGGRCEFIWDFNRCKRRAIDPSHILARSQGGKHTLENLKHACRVCHNYCTEHPKEAVHRGFIIPYEGYNSYHE